MADELTERIIGAAIEVHRLLGPGLLEVIYEEALCHELGLRGLPFLRLGGFKSEVQQVDDDA
jgi:GxxExxY protein